ncbi:MAG: hypothetical protein IKS21_02225 [Oscillospiraceae bacterium]|nr:hypothetical protein [Oscillospiraceae bacterium]
MQFAEGKSKRAVPPQRREIALPGDCLLRKHGRAMLVPTPAWVRIGGRAMRVPTSSPYVKLLRLHRTTG